MSSAGGRDERARPRSVHTIGHSALRVEELVRRLREAGVRGLADVRRFPASRRHPQFNRTELADRLAVEGLEYRWFEALGGRRPPASKEASPNRGLRVEGFRGYADYALTGEFREALRVLEAWGEEIPAAVCCAEALWWQCHRRILADHLVTRGWTVIHILGDGRLEPHRVWDLARITSEGPVYPSEQPELFAGSH